MLLAAERACDRLAVSTQSRRDAEECELEDSMGCAPIAAGLPGKPAQSSQASRRCEIQIPNP